MILGLLNNLNICHDHWVQSGVIWHPAEAPLVNMTSFTFFFFFNAKLCFHQGFMSSLKQHVFVAHDIVSPKQNKVSEL